jgi:hypothetical protein
MVDDLHREKNFARQPRLGRAAVAVATRALTISLVAIAGLIAASLVCADALTDARPRPIPISAIAGRFIFDLPPPAVISVDLSAARRDAADAMAALSARTEAARKGDRFAAARDCCAAGALAASAPCPHFVTVSLRVGEATSTLVRYEAPDVRR